MDKTKYTHHDHLDNFKKQLALRDKFVKENYDGSPAITTFNVRNGLLLT